MWFDYVYSHKDLTHTLQRLNREGTQRRMVCFLLNFANTLLAGYLLTFRALLMYMTHITVMMTWLYFLSALMATHYKSLQWLAVHHILFTASLIANSVVMIFYWTLLHEEQLTYYEGKPLSIFQLYWAHIFPGLSIFTNFAVTDVILRASHAKFIMMLGVVYLYINYSDTVRL